MDGVGGRVERVLDADDGSLSPTGLGEGRLDGLGEVQGGLAAGHPRVEDGCREDEGLRKAPDEVREVGQLRQGLRAAGHDDALSPLLDLGGGQLDEIAAHPQRIVRERLKAPLLRCNLLVKLLREERLQLLPLQRNSFPGASLPAMGDLPPGQDESYLVSVLHDACLSSLPDGRPGFMRGSGDQYPRLSPTMMTCVLLPMVGRSRMRSARQTRDGESQSTQWPVRTQGVFPFSRRTLGGVAVRARFMASSSEPTTLLTPMTKIRTLRPQAIALTRFPLPSIFTIIPSRVTALALVRK